MSDTAQGPGWWQASDGKWYPPEQHPSQRASTELPNRSGPPAEPAGAAIDLPVTLLGGGAVGSLIGVFLPWATSSFADVDGIDTDDGKLMLVLAVAALVFAAVFAFVRDRWAAITALVIGLLVIALALFEIVDVASDDFFDVEPGLGLYLGAVSGVVYAAGAALGLRR